MALFITHLLGALSCASGLAAAAESNVASDPATVEFDVVFPSNITYASAEVFPIIFALQNWPTARPTTSLQIKWTLDVYKGHHIDDGFLTLPDNTTSDAALDPYYIKLWTPSLNGLTGGGNVCSSLGVHVYQLFRFLPGPYDDMHRRQSPLQYPSNRQTT
jgi:hypothetical protein